MSTPNTRSAALRVALHRLACLRCAALVITLLIACAHAAWSAAAGDPVPGTSASANIATVRPGRCPSLAREPYAAPVFLGYACRDRECTTHKAGFAWAERNGVTDVGECAASPNPAFVEGCRAYAEETVTPEQAGFEWARENELDDACRCRGGGAGFEAGCAAYVTEGGR